MKTTELPAGPTIQNNASAGAGTTDSRTEAIVASLVTIEMKLDKVLRYQKQARHMATLRVAISFLFFMVFIVLPIIGGWYLFKQFQSSVDLSQVVDQYKDFYETVGELGGQVNQLQQAGQMLNDLAPTIGLPVGSN